MDGRSVYKFATREVPRVLSEALANAGLTVDDVDHLLLHQANIRIMETVAQRLGIDFDKGRLGMSSLDGRLPYGQLTVQQPNPFVVITNLDQNGNTSAGSIPIALSEAVANGKVKKGDIIACSGFGAGLSWGAVILRWG